MVWLKNLVLSVGDDGICDVVFPPWGDRCGTSSLLIVVALVCLGGFDSRRVDGLLVVLRVCLVFF